MPVAVKDLGLPIRLSPSQVESSACAHAWGLAYLDKVQKPPNDAADAGGRLHKILETYYATQVLPAASAEGQVILHAREHFPKPGKGVVSEMPFYDVEFAGGVFGGKIEGREMRADVVDVSDPKKPKLWDLKTTSDLKWAKTREELEENLQAAIYSKALLRDYPEATEVKCRWVYVTRPTRSKPKTKTHPVDFVMTRESIAIVEAKWHNKITDLVRWHFERPAVETLPKNTAVCSAYGGCSFGPGKLNVCKMTPTERIRSIMAGNTPDLKNAVADLLKGTKAGGLAPPKTAPPTPAAPAAKPAFSFKKPAAPPPPPPPTASNFTLPETEDGQIPEDQRAEFLGFCMDNSANPLDHLGLTPDDAFLEEATAIVEAHRAALAPTAAPEPEEPEVETAPEVVEEPETAEETATREQLLEGVAENARRRRGRPPGSTNKPKGDAEDGTVTVVLPARLAALLEQALVKFLGDADGV